MKKTTIKPGFEFIFSLSIIAILGLPALLFAQTTTTKTDEQISIVNGDTTVNGKNIKDLSAKDKQEALKDISKIATINFADKPNYHRQRDIVIEGDAPMPPNSGMRPPRHRDSTFNLKLMPPRGDAGMRRREGGPMGGFNPKNTEMFSYTTTDNNGISTHISYRVTDPSGPVAHVPGEMEPSQYELMAITDLTIVPQFSEGKTTISFNLTSKEPAEVRLKDSNGNILWTDKTTNGTFVKTFSLGLNGEYILHVKQGGKLAVKKIIKE
jgi:hypothetical protein